MIIGESAMLCGSSGVCVIVRFISVRELFQVGIIKWVYSVVLKWYEERKRQVKREAGGYMKYSCLDSNCQSRCFSYLTYRMAQQLAER